MWTQKWCKITKYGISVQVRSLQDWNFAGLMCCKDYTLWYCGGDDVTIVTYSLTDLYPLKMKNALFFAPLSNRLFCACANAHISLHPLNEQREEIKGGKLWFYLLNGEGLKPIVLPWKCHGGHIMELCDKCNNCTKFQFMIQKNRQSRTTCSYFNRREIKNRNGLACNPDKTEDHYALAFRALLFLVLIGVGGYLRSPTPAAQDLRVLVDSHLMLSKYVNSVCKSAFFSVSIFGPWQMLLAVPKTKTKLYGDWSFATRAPRLWNALPVDIKNSKSLNIFQVKVRRPLLTFC